MTVFAISALRAVVEMLGLCLLGQGVLYVLAGKSRGSNRIYQLFNLITQAPRRLVARMLPGAPGGVVAVLCFVILLLIWIGLAFLRKTV